MSKKYVFFKTNAQLDNIKATKSLVKLEMDAILPDCLAIPTIFQLLNFESLKQIILKDTIVQTQLAFNLSQIQPHGFLWQGEALPLLNTMLNQTGTISEIFVWMRVGDSNTEFIPESYFKYGYTSTIYNWQYIHLWSFNILWRLIRPIRQNTQNEVEIDERVKKLTTILKSADYPKRLTQSDLDNTAEGYSYFSDRYDHKSHYDNVLNQVLLMQRNTSDEEKILFPFIPKNGYLLQTLMLDNPYIALGIDPLRLQRMQAYQELPYMSANLLNNAISRIITHLKHLNPMEAIVQPDLFLNDIKKEFELFWSEEKKRLNNANLQSVPSSLQSFVASVRFLIEAQHISPSASINHFLSLALTIFILRHFNKSIAGSYLEAYHSILRQNYLDYYLINTVLPKDKLKTKKFHQTYKNDVTDMNAVISDSIGFVLARMPARINKTEPTDLHGLFELLNWHEDILNPSAPFFGSKLTDDKTTALIEDAIRQRRGFYATLGHYGQIIIDQFCINNRRNDAVQLFHLWQCYYLFLEELQRIVNPAGRIVLVIKNPKYKLNDRFKDIRMDEIVSDFIRDPRSLSHLKIVDQFYLTLPPGRFGQTAGYHVLILQKT
ncbi:MAG: hypothetical protein GF313_00330 [Caldithrix sp.]|nr:hypothetical protein [Caldithrix sp.]